MEFAPLVVVTSPVLYASTGLRVKRGESISFVNLHLRSKRDK
jgi:hypothetical protein